MISQSDICINKQGRGKGVYNVLYMYCQMAKTRKSISKKALIMPLVHFTVKVYKVTSQTQRNKCGCNIIDGLICIIGFY